MMLVHSNNPYEDTKTELIAQKMVGKRTFIGWPFLQNLTILSLEVSGNLQGEDR